MPGMRGLLALLTETSVLDAETGLKLHGIKMRELLLERLPKMKEEHEYPSVEALLWFLLTCKAGPPCLFSASLLSPLHESLSLLSPLSAVASLDIGCVSYALA